MEILKGVDPKGKIVKITTRSNKMDKEVTNTYIVTHVSGLDTNLPSESEKVVYLRVYGPQPNTPTPYLTIPLSTLVDDTMHNYYPKITPETKADVFWEFPVVDKES